MQVVNPVHTVNITAAAPSVTFFPFENTATALAGTEVLISSDSVFSGATILLESWDESLSKWMATGVSFSAIGAKVIRMRAGIQYRLSTSTVAGLNVFFSFHGS